jgi:hypothetical protein
MMAAAYGTALLFACLSFLAWRVVVHHRTFAARTFFWLGDIYGADEAIGFRMQPNRTGTAVLHHGVADPARRIAVRTDAHGFRIPLADAGAGAAPGGLAAIGCSCTFGHGVAAESTYVALAGTFLQLPVSNLGVCSYSGVTSALLLERHIARLRPAVVIYGCGNFHLERDARRRIDGTVWQAAAVSKQGEVVLAPPPFSNARAFGMNASIEAQYYAPRLEGAVAALTPARIATLLPLACEDLGRALHPASWRARGAPAALPELEFYRFLLRRMQSTCKAHGARFVLLFLPAFLGERPSPGLLAAAVEFGADPDFLFVDCGPQLFEGIPDQATYALRWQVPRDGHPNRFMHLEMARTLVAALRP